MSELREGGLLISKVKQLSGRIFDKMLKDNGITDLNTAQGRIMFALWKNNPVPIRELVKQTALSKTTLTGMLERMEQAGHLVRTAHAEDKRSTLVSLTERSLQLKSLYDQVSLDMLDVFYHGLTEEEVDRFEETLRRILHNLAAYETEE